jgi:hypothetical protein
MGESLEYNGESSTPLSTFWGVRGPQVGRRATEPVQMGTSGPEDQWWCMGAVGNSLVDLDAVASERFLGL